MDCTVFFFGGSDYLMGKSSEIETWTKHHERSGISRQPDCTTGLEPPRMEQWSWWFGEPSLGGFCDVRFVCSLKVFSSPKRTEKPLKMAVSNRNPFFSRGLFSGAFAVSFREGILHSFFNWQFFCEESEGEIYFSFFPLYVSFVWCDVQGHGRLSEGKAGLVGSRLSCHASRVQPLR